MNVNAVENVRTFVPVNALTYAPILKSEQLKFWSSIPSPELLGGLVEQETCLSLTHSRCWMPSSKLKTSREEGAGLGQITRAYNKDGSIRFDALTELKTAHPTIFSEWSWDNVYDRPDLQLRAVVVKTNDDFKYLKVVSEEQERLKFTLAAYNGGRGGVQNERRACGLKDGCNPQIWFGNVEKTCLKSKAVLYGNKSACDINREYVNNIYNIRSQKYTKLMSQPKVVEQPNDSIHKKTSILNRIWSFFLNLFKGA